MSVHIFFLIERVLGSKNLLCKSCSEHPITGNRCLFWGTLVTILDFSGGSMFLIEGVLGSKTISSSSLGLEDEGQ